MLEQEKVYEQRRLERTLEEIDRQLQEKKADKQAYTMNMRTTFKNMWDEVEVAPNNMMELEQLVQAKLYLDEMRNMESAYQSSLQKMIRLEKMMDSPYFARIDFIEKGEPGEEQIYIGLTMVQNEETLEILVYDWRAPISGMFYDYDTGKAMYDSPVGRIEGELTLKRQFRIKNGQIQVMFDSDVKIDDDILQELLGQSKDEKMRTIVTSIQREQNLAIRDEGHRLLIVEGPAGSGKTSIALHRIAFLLYRYRNSMTNANVVIFSPNEMFNDYISDVLPELGEDNVRQTTFMAYAKTYLRTNMKIDDLNQQMEFILSRREMTDYAERVETIRYKSSIAFLTLLKKYIEWLYQNPWTFEDIGSEQFVIITREEQLALFQRDYAYLPMIPRLKKIKNRILFLIKQQEHIKVDALTEQMRHDLRWMDLKPQEQRKRAVKIVLKQFQPLREKARTIGDYTIRDYYIGLYRNDNFSGNFREKISSDMADLTLRRLEQNIVLYEDLAPMLYLKGKLYGIPKKESIRHVIIDEVQDYTPLQMEIIRELFPSSSFTVVGDLNQSVNPYANIGTIEGLKGIFNVEDMAHIRLDKSYRSTRQITQFCRSILKNTQDIEYINREGTKPTVRILSDLDECIAWLKKDIPTMTKAGYQSIAVICRTRAETQDVYHRLKKYVPCHLVIDADASFPKGLTLLPSYLAKGLEFDVAFILNLYHPYQGAEDQNLFYTVCTRALHRLAIYTTGSLPEYVQRIPCEMYDIVKEQG